MADVDLLDALLAHLAGQGIVRRPDTAGAAPPLWREPAGGAPAPGERKGTGNDATTVVSAYVSGEIPRAPGQGYSDRLTVDLRIRTKDPRVGPDLSRAIADELAPPPYGVRHDWTMGGLHLIESRQWRGLGRLGSDPAQGFDFVVAYLFEIRVE